MTTLAQSDATNRGSVSAVMIEDHTLFAELMRSALGDNGINVVSVATTGSEGLRHSLDLEPDVVLIDLRLPDADGLNVGKAILEELPNTKIVAVSALDDPASIRETLDAGFHGYLTKDTPIDEFIEGIRGTMAGGKITTRVPVQAKSEVSPEQRDAEMRARNLTQREKEVLMLLAEGAGSPEIARRICVSPNTVRSHVQNILTKLQVHSRLEAATFAVRYGIIELQNAS